MYIKYHDKLVQSFTSKVWHERLQEAQEWGGYPRAEQSNGRTSETASIGFQIFHGITPCEYLITSEH